MANKRLSMRQIKKLLRLSFGISSWFMSRPH